MTPEEREEKIAQMYALIRDEMNFGIGSVLGWIVDLQERVERLESDK